MVKLDLDLDLDPDPDPHSEKLLNPDLDPHKVNANPQPWMRFTILDGLRVKNNTSHPPNTPGGPLRIIDGKVSLKGSSGVIIYS